MFISRDPITDLLLVIIALVGVLGALSTIFLLTFGLADIILLSITTILLRKKKKDKPP